MKVIIKTASIIRKTLYVSFLTVSLLLSVFILLTLIPSSLDLSSGFKSFIVVSGSMEPAISTGSLIYTFPKDNYSKNDIIAFKQGEKVITHRIIGFERVGSETFYQTKGDANRFTDENLVSPSEVLGATTIATPFMGNVLMFFKSPLGFAAGIVLPALLFLVLELGTVAKRFRYPVVPITW